MGEMDSASLGAVSSRHVCPKNGRLTKRSATHPRVGMVDDGHDVKGRRAHRGRPPAPRSRLDLGELRGEPEHPRPARVDPLRIAAREELQPLLGRGVRTRSHGLWCGGPDVRSARSSGLRSTFVRPAPGAGASVIEQLVGGACLDLARTARRHDRRLQEPDRLDTAGRRGGPTDARPHARGLAGLRREPVVQRGQPTAGARALDADVHDSESIVGAQGLRGVRRRRSDEAIGSWT